MKTDSQYDSRHEFPRAKYVLNSLPIYQGNPMIESLQDYQVYGMNDIINLLERKLEPIHPMANRKQRDNWLLNLTSNLFIPLKHHIDLHETVDALIRYGYANRRKYYNSKEYIDILKDNNQISEKEEEKLISNTIIKNNYYNNSQSLSLIGDSGMGKTYAVSQVLSFYPQVIVHDMLPGNSPVIQVVYIKVECPHDGSVKSLCASIIQELGIALHEDFFDAFVNKGRPSISLLKSRLSHLLAAYNVGILIIDEIQNLLVSKMEREQLFNFIVSMTNELGIPLLFVGTPKAEKIMHTSLRTGRRFGSHGVLRWSRMEYKSREWNKFFGTLWKYNVLMDKNDPDEEIEKLFYDYSQGIAAVLVKIFVLFQKRALILNHKKPSKEILDEIYKSYLSNVRPMIDAIKNNDTRSMEKYEDISFITQDFENASQKLSEELDIASQQSETFEDRITTWANRLASSLQSVPENLHDEIMNKLLAGLEEHKTESVKNNAEIDRAPAEIDEQNRESEAMNEDNISCSLNVNDSDNLKIDA